MPAKFDDNGISFLYPENWQLERESNDEGWAVSVQSPSTAFLLLTVNARAPSPEEMLAATLEALKAEYKDLEFEDCVESVAGQPAVGHDIRFISLDLTNTCWTRSFYSAAGTVLVFASATTSKATSTKRYCGRFARRCRSTTTEPAPAHTPADTIVCCPIDTAESGSSISNRSATLARLRSAREPITKSGW